MWKSLCSPKEHEQKLKTWMGDSTENVDKKSTTPSKNDKTGVECWNMFEHKENAILN